MKIFIRLLVIILGVVFCIALYFGYRIFLKPPFDAPGITGDVTKLTIAQEEIEQEYLIDEDVVLYIYTPENYDSSKPLPIIYVLDGDMLFKGTAGFVSEIHEKNQNNGAIVVGVGYGYWNPYFAEQGKGRWRDYAFEKEGSVITNPNGHNFYKFLTAKVQPLMSERFNIDQTKQALMGHSMGGDFSYFAALQEVSSTSPKFTHFIIGDGGDEPHFEENYMPQFERNLLQNAMPFSTSIVVYRVWGEVVNDVPSMKQQEDMHQWLTRFEDFNVKSKRYFPLGQNHADTMKTTIENGVMLVLQPENVKTYNNETSYKF